MAASAALTEALQLAWALGPRLMVAVAMERLAGVVVEQGQADLAVRLLAPAAMRAQMGTPLWPEGCLARIRPRMHQTST